MILTENFNFFLLFKLFLKILKFQIKYEHAFDRAAGPESIPKPFGLVPTKMYDLAGARVQVEGKSQFGPFHWARPQLDA